VFVAAALSAALPGHGMTSAQARGKAPAASPSPSMSPTPTPQERISTLSQSVRDNPNDRVAREELGVLLVQNGKPAEGRDQLQSALRLGVNDAQTWFFIGEADRMLGSTADAVGALERAENLDPANGAVLSNLVDVYLAVGRTEDAQRVANRAVQLHPKEAFAFEALGAAQLSAGKLDDARRAFQQAIALDPKDVRAKILTGRSYLADKRPNADLALAQFNSVLAGDPKNTEALSAKAEALAQKNDVAGAAAALEQVVKLQPDSVEPELAVAQLYFSKNLVSQGRDALARAIKEHPKSPQPFALEAAFDAKAKNYAQAAKEYESALALTPDDSRLLFEYGRLQLVGLNQPAKARDAFAKILNHDPNNPELLFWLGQSYAADRQWLQARDQYQRSFQLSHTYTALFGLGLAFFNLNDFKSAQQAFLALAQHQVKARPDPQVWLMLGETDRRLGDRKGAVAAYKRFLAIDPRNGNAAKVRNYIKQLSART
jgi:tetratricopeptide (TPR) repeat protein